MATSIASCTCLYWTWTNEERNVLTGIHLFGNFLKEENSGVTQIPLEHMRDRMVIFLSLSVLLHLTDGVVSQYFDVYSRWPSPAELAKFDETIDGIVYFPGSLGYINGSTMMNTRWNSLFGVVVMVQSTSDVQKAILFCQTYGIQPTIKSSGHDFIGRASGAHTFSINLLRMNAISRVVKDERSETGFSLQVESGSRWESIYRHVHNEGYLVLGGAVQTVSAGGYTLGGGHSPLSRMLGLAVDNLIEFTIVISNGSIIRMTKDGGKIRRQGSLVEEDYYDPELFWAVRGGGGSTFGVVTSFTYQAHVPPSDGFCHLTITYPVLHSTQGNVGDKVLRSWGEYMLTKLSRKWGGFIMIRGGPSDNSTNQQQSFIEGTLSFSLLHYGSCFEAQSTVDSLMNIFPENRLHQSVTPFPTFWEFVRNVIDEAGYRVYIINRFLQTEDLMVGSRLPEILSQVPKIPKVAAQVGCTWMLLGGKVQDYPVHTSAVSPDFRSAVGSITCGVGWNSQNNDDRNIQALRDYGTTFYSIGRGVYYNEPDYYLFNWQTEYWGNTGHYNRLLEAKQRYDPQGMFRCHHCVAEEIFQTVGSRANKIQFCIIFFLFQIPAFDLYMNFK